MKPEVGQTLYSLNVGNAARNGEQKLTPVKVTKVGRKYFTCGEGWKETQYRIDGWFEKTDYSADSELYLSPEAWEEEKQIPNLFRVISNELGAYSCNRKITLSQLKKIAKILNLQHI